MAISYLQHKPVLSKLCISPNRTTSRSLSAHLRGPAARSRARPRPVPDRPRKHPMLVVSLPHASQCIPYVLFHGSQHRSHQKKMCALPSYPKKKGPVVSIRRVSGTGRCSAAQWAAGPVLRGHPSLASRIAVAFSPEAQCFGLRDRRSHDMACRDNSQDWASHVKVAADESLCGF